MVTSGWSRTSKNQGSRVKHRDGHENQEERRNLPSIFANNIWRANHKWPLMHLSSSPTHPGLLRIIVPMPALVDDSSIVLLRLPKAQSSKPPTDANSKFFTMKFFLMQKQNITPLSSTSYSSFALLGPYVNLRLIGLEFLQVNTYTETKLSKISAHRGCSPDHVTLLTPDAFLANLKSILLGFFQCVTAEQPTQHMYCWPCGLTRRTLLNPSQMDFCTLVRNLSR